MRRKTVPFFIKLAFWVCLVLLGTDLGVSTAGETEMVPPKKITREGEVWVSQGVWETEVLFRVDYGSDDEQLGVRIPPEGMEGYSVGPGFLRLDSSGNFYIGDGVNHKLKKFSPQGDFLAAWTDVPAGYTPTPDGGMVGWGSRFEEHPFEKFSADGEKLWTRQLPEEALNILGTSYFLHYMYVSPNGNIYLPYQHNWPYEDAVTVELDPEGNFLRKIDRLLPVGPNHHFYYFKPFPSDKPSIAESSTLTLYDAEGEQLREYKFQGWMAGASANPRCLFMDKYERLISTRLVSRAMEGVEFTTLAPGMVIRADVSVKVFDKEGKKVGEIAWTRAPFHVGIGIADVDLEGNIYHLEYHTDHLNVIRTRLVPPAPPEEP